MILYFSGTGNSRFVAEQLAEQLGDTVVSVNERLKNGNFEALTDENRFVFVSPIYVFSPALVLEDFIRKTPLCGTKKVWFVMTGAGKGSAGTYYFQKLCRQKGLQYMGTEHIVMPQNYIVYFSTKAANENEKTVANALPEIERLARTVAENTAFADTKVGRATYLSVVAVRRPYYRFFVKAKKFSAGKACTGCGKCARVCPLNNITVQNGRPVWGKNCTHCMACINLCPTESIEYGKKTVGKPRYNYFK